MHITMVAAMSQDGFITDGDNPDPSEWTSKEDQVFFHNILQAYKCLILGLKTYQANPGAPKQGRLRIVLTHNPEKFRKNSVPGQLEFINATPTELVKNYGKYWDKALLVGGGQVFESFLAAGLVSEIYLTIEPLTLGTGTPILASGKKIEELAHLPKPTVTELNNSGTLLYHYVLSV